MTDNGHTDHEQLTRRLHEQGQAQAPASLAGDVMRQVRAEPRRHQPTWLRPVALCAAVAVLLAASIVGLARIGGSGQSSSAGSAAETHAAMGAVPRTSQGGGQAPGDSDAKAPNALRNLMAVPADKLATLSPLPFCAAQAHTYALRVPAGRYAAVSRQLRTWATATPAGATTYNVQIRRAPASAQLALTCP
ncbi:MAG TPA: hypothetical protein VM712_16755 [Gaiellales bacterium]|jgi:hypothetical protein|nr:hypothetical protein [Gaiellales bacterium]